MLLLNNNYIEYKIVLLNPLRPLRFSGKWAFFRYGLSAGDQLLLVMMKLRYATAHKDLTYRFGIHISRVTKNFHHWIDVMSREMQQLISWPDHGKLYWTALSQSTPGQSVS